MTSVIREGGDEDLRNDALEKTKHHKALPLVPVTFGLDKVGVAGLYGDATAVDSLAASLIIQAAVLHSPEDLIITGAFASADQRTWDWMKWLPHTRAATSPLEGAHLVDESDANDLLRRLGAMLNTRLGQSSNSTSPWPRILFALYQDANIDRVGLARLLDSATAAGVIVLWIGRETHHVPRQSRALVQCHDGTEDLSLLRYTDPAVDDQLLDLEGITPEVAASG